MQTDFDRDLLAYFTDVEYLRDAFKQMVAAPMLTKRLFLIHGVGGVGKSSLLRIFRFHCKSENVPITLVSGDETKSAVDVLSFKSPSGEERGWVPDLKADGVRFPKFDATLEHYRAIQAEVEEQVKKAQGARSRAADIAGKAASKAAEAAGGALAGVAIGSVIPGIGTAIGGVVGGVLGGVGMEALVDWLRGFLKQPDIDLLRDPTKKLTDDFLTDVANAAEKRRIVLMLDTFEQMTTLDDWARDVAQRSHANILLVIAGRITPDWSKKWDGWLARARIEELEPMPKRVMNELIHRYYVAMGGGEIDPKQAQAIIEFARGLPMAVNTAVYLMWKYHLRSFQAVKAEATEDLVEEMRKGLPKETYPSLEAAATVRWFNREILRELLKQREIDAIYDELGRFPFVRPHIEGLAFHDRIREIFADYLRIHDPQRQHELHERAAAYFAKRLEKVADAHHSTTGEEAERLLLERIYHLILSGDEPAALAESDSAIDTAIGSYRRLFAESVIALLDQHLRQEDSRRWMAYLRFQVGLLNPYIQVRVIESQTLARIVDEPGLQPRLRVAIAVALQDVPGEANISFELRKSLLEEAIKSGLLNPRQMGKAHWRMGIMYRAASDWERTLQHLDLAGELYGSVGDQFGQAMIAEAIAYTLFLMGDWHHAEEQAQRAVNLSRRLSGFNMTTSLKTLGWIQTYLGKLSFAESAIKESLKLAQQQQDAAQIVRVSRRLAETYDRQRRWTLSVPLYQDMMATDEKFGRVISRAWLAALLGVSYLSQGLYRQAEKLFLDALAHKYTEIEEIALNGMGELNLILGHYVEALNYFERNRDVSKGRPYYVTQSLTGLARVKHAQGDFAAIAPLLAESEQLAQHYEYNDHLASLWLTQGHIAWEGHIPEWDSGFDAALRHYQHALIYALRYNRFLLDEVLSGRLQGTPLRPIIPHCLERGKDGRQMLTALRDWWKTGVNDIGMPHPDTISPIPKGITLLEVERLAREREPGDGSPQKSVVEQIDMALSGREAG